MRVRIIHLSLQLCAYQPVVGLICCSLARWLSIDFGLFQVYLLCGTFGSELSHFQALGLFLRLAQGCCGTTSHQLLHTVSNSDTVKQTLNRIPHWSTLLPGMPWSLGLSVSQALAASAWLVNVSQCAITDRGKTFSNAWPTSTGLLEV